PTAGAGRDHGTTPASFVLVPGQRRIGNGVLVELRRDRDAAVHGREHRNGVGDERAQGSAVGERITGAQRQFVCRPAAFAPLPVAALPLLARRLEAAFGSLGAVVLPAAARRERQWFAQAGGTQADQLAQRVLRLGRIDG